LKVLLLSVHCLIDCDLRDAVISLFDRELCWRVLMTDLTVRQTVDAALAKIEILNSDINALVHVDAASARDQADSLDRWLGYKGSLFGTTFVVKDLIDIAHQPTHAGSRLLSHQPVGQDAGCVARLRAAGAVVLGKANMHELAVGGAINPWFGQVINPLLRTHGTGGTSSGSAAAVAAGFCHFSLGTDSGGSNRSVAAATGLYGYKPSNGLIALDGVVPTSPTMDTVGVIAHTAQLISSCLEALVGKVTAKEELLEGHTFARITNLLTSPVDGVVSDAVEFAFASITSRGGRVVNLDVHAPDILMRAGVAILRYEFAKIYGERIDCNSESVGAAIHAFLHASRQISTNQYEDAQSLRLEHQARWTSMLAQVDGFISPTAPGLAPDLSAEMCAVGTTRVAYGAAGAEFRMWANTIGIPVVAIPVRRTSGLPTSIQLAGAKHSDGLVIDLAAALGRAFTEGNS
jgi:Asp-tRNA(Asn)/Glu-tRNA(Gln) amidotransferase A subunit family amidase